MIERTTNVERVRTPSFRQWRFHVFISTARQVIQLVDDLAILRQGGLLTPAGGPPTTRVSVVSGSRLLDARLCRPKASPVAAVLILHGIGERVDYWQQAQRLLAEERVASLVVAYSGYGASAGATTPANLREDVVAAFAELQRLVPTAEPPFLLGLSLGTGVAVDATPYLVPAPSGVILCQPFSTLREGAVAVCAQVGVPRALAKMLARLLPDIYKTEETVQRLLPPVLIIHSEDDELFPVWMARHIFFAARLGGPAHAELVVPHGFGHNDCFARPSIDYWLPILNFMAKQTRAKRARSLPRP